MKIKISLAQISTVLGNIKANLEKHNKLIESALSQSADIIIFPELALTGYILQDLASEVAIEPNSISSEFSQLLQASKDIDIVTSFVEKGSHDQLYISAVYLSNEEIIHIHKKIYLPTYGMFDELRFFTPGNNVQAFDTRFGRIGLLICEDFWHISPPYILWQDGAELMIFISASPSRGLTTGTQLESAKWVDHITQAYSSLFSCFVAHTNKVGFEDGLNFWGGATIHGPRGELLVKAPEHEEAITFCEVNLNEISRIRKSLPLYRDEKPELIITELSRIQDQNQ